MFPPRSTTFRAQVRFFALRRIEPHAPPLVRAPVNSFEFLARMLILAVLHRKEVIQPQVLLRLPCYDFTPIMDHTLDGCPLAVGSPASSAVHFRDVTGGVYKARERIHRSVLICDY